MNTKKYRRCKTCKYRAGVCSTSQAVYGCDYMLITGHSRLAAVYKALGTGTVTDEVREAMSPEHCLLYEKGKRLRTNRPVVG